MNHARTASSSSHKNIVKRYRAIKEIGELNLFRSHNKNWQKLKVYIVDGMGWLRSLAYIQIMFSL